MSLYTMIKLKQHGDIRGDLVAIEENDGVPFQIKRVYYIFNTKPNIRRGFHSHKKLKQVLICVHGSCKIHLDNGFETTEILLDKPYEGLLIEHNIWREMYDFSEDAVLLVLASELYDESDYIRDYQKFKEFISAGEK